MNDDGHFSLLSEEILRRAARAVVSQVGPSSPALREHLIARLTREAGSEGSFLAPPVFESLFDWATHDQSIESVPYLSRRLIDAMDAPLGDGAEFRFPRERRPRTHQLHAWDVLCNDPVRSVLVRTGTASGKTECFMVPVLNDLARELDASVQPTPLEGVRALFLYPLNALIQSQRNRLRAWCSGFKGGLVRFALYNGLTKERVERAKAAEHPEEVLSRVEIRKSPPPVLVTNGTMLEYMLVRGSDGPILTKSKGKLRWIVLDEAHTYLGSAAAEVALLLRRVMDAFEVDPKEVRFVATSATIGDADQPSTTQALKSFLAKLGGIDPAQVEVVDGRRVAPSLPASALGEDTALPSLDELRAMTSEQRFAHMASVPSLRTAREALTARHMRLADLSKILYGADGAVERRDTLEVLDLASSTRLSAKETAFLPLRGHFFARTMAGLWACCDPACKGGDDVKPRGEGWPFGALFLARRTHCDHCSARVFEVQFCRACGAAYLGAFKTTDAQGIERWSALEPGDEDDEVSEDEGGDDDDEKSSWDPKRVLIVGGDASHGAAGPITMHRVEGVLDDMSPSALELAFIPVPGDNPQCVRCREGHRADRPFVAPARLGANFFLGVNIPTLLEQEDARPEDIGPGGVPNKPAEGRRLLTFTDSRQGSARFALRSQLGAQRNYTRAFVYHRLWSQAQTPDTTRVEELRDLIDLARQASPMSPRRARLQELERALAKELAGAPISWADMTTQLAQSPVLRWVRQAMSLQYPPAASLSEHHIAGLALMSEFARRPRRMNSLETMGLAALNYVGLDAVGDAPSSWHEAGFRDEEWRPFLKLAIDFFVRNHTALSVNREDFRWIGSHFSTPVILPPGADGATKNRAYPWPTVEPGKGLTRIPRYLRALLGPGEEEKQARPAIDAILRDAWTAIVGAKILVQGDNGYRLDLAAQGRFNVVRDAWLCPITGRLLDTTLRRRSPYLPATWEGVTECARVEMPSLKHPFPKVEGVSPEAVRAWLERDDKVLRARELGVWSEFSDRIASLAPTLYFRSGEHSAQQDHEVLKALEDGFNAHDVNVLSCSTTMEMGVDIGGLNTVAMNNVPPAPANYRQRAGRAGRSGASRATVMTLCNTTPHGEEVFSNPLWPFEAKVAMPSVSLESPRITARHVRALCLGRYLRSRGISDGTTLECRGFFLPVEGAKLSVAAEFIASLRAGSDDGLDAAIARLVVHTAYQGASSSKLIDDAIEALEAVERRWRSEREGIVSTLVDLEGSEGMAWAKAIAPQRAVLIQLKRHDEEYLLRFLAAEGFLPSHGFPMHVVPFVTLTVDQFVHHKQAEQDAKESREDVPTLRTGFPSRHLAQAIREYAPGAGVVVNGMVYDSAGIALAWKRPVTADEANEIQDLGMAWQCARCGAADFTPQLPAICPRCGRADLRKSKMLRPTGFSVDFYAAPHNDVGQQHFVPVEEPWISAGGAAWTALGGTVVGRYRYATDGVIVYRNRGVNRCGYAICLHCGRAAPESSYPKESGVHELPADLVGHRRLRRSKHEDVVCTGNNAPFAIKRNVVLGGREHTDVLELQLQMPGTAAPVADGRVCSTLAVALRRALAERLGVDPREIGWAVMPSETAAGAKTHSLVLFDTAEGGAGYVTAGAPLLRELVAEIPKYLACPRRCDGACHGCLVGYDTQWHVDRLDRKTALAALPDAFFKALALPDSLRVFGESTELMCVTGLEAFERILQEAHPSAVRVHLGGADDAWDLSSWPLLPRLRHLAEHGVAVTLVLTEARLTSLSWDEAREVMQQASVGGFRVEVVKAPTSVNGAALALEIEAGLRGLRVAVVGDSAWAPNVIWGAGDGTSVVLSSRHEGSLPKIDSRSAKSVELDRLPPGYTQHFAWSAGALSGSVEHVGKRFWDGLMKASPALGAALKGSVKLSRVRLRDRYVTSPLVMRVLFEVFRHLKTAGFADGATQFVLDTRWNAPEYNTPTNGLLAVHRGLPSEPLLRETLAAIWKELGKGTPTVHSALHHDRVLELEWAQQKLSIYLHQGVSFLRSEGSPKVTLGVSGAALAKELLAKSFDLSMPESTTVHIGAAE